MLSSTIEIIDFVIVGYKAPSPGENIICCYYQYLGNDDVLSDVLRQGIVLAAMGVGGGGDNRLQFEAWEAQGIIKVPNFDVSLDQVVTSYGVGDKQYCFL
ncbi:hypothetical protein J2Z49_000725 [Desulfofundulus luciae]|uniref:Uncharacterized protein n=1 Tax=Desulfofundulus luciae TaxID=74702 RepID=A0ABU0B128_9FIRM|nr:hypothetical protein [Desulfofundulus luciae]MDQ0285621.1 hypothetical protein [Desulfofundulus luciae]